MINQNETKKVKTPKESITIQIPLEVYRAYMEPKAYKDQVGGKKTVTLQVLLDKNNSKHVELYNSLKQKISFLFKRNVEEKIINESSLNYAVTNKKVSTPFLDLDDISDAQHPDVLAKKNKILSEKPDLKNHYIVSFKASEDYLPNVWHRILDPSRDLGKEPKKTVDTKVDTKSVTSGDLVCVQGSMSVLEIKQELFVSLYMNHIMIVKKTNKEESAPFSGLNIEGFDDEYDVVASELPKTSATPTATKPSTHNEDMDFPF